MPPIFPVFVSRCFRIWLEAFVQNSKDMKRSDSKSTQGTVLTDTATQLWINTSSITGSSLQHDDCFEIRMK